MSLEHLQEINDRIEEIRRRFVDSASKPTAEVESSARRIGFGEALQKAQTVRTVPCPSDLDAIISRSAERHGVPAAVIKAVVCTESGFRNDAVSRVGAQGLMQLMPGTARALGVDPTDPEQNIDGGTKYLKRLIDKFGSLEPALAAYNAGPGAVVRYGGVPPYRETQRYVHEVMGHIDAYSKD
jgi:soluble lytic murein transglycosylase-like protein